MYKNIQKNVSIIILVTFIFTSVNIQAYAQVIAQGQTPWMPTPGTMISISPSFEPALIKGLTVHQDNPFLFDFIVDPGQAKMSKETLKEESDRMIKYFFASLTLPDRDIWVNLSPYEKDRMIPASLGVTTMGRDLLAQDYMLKQLTASLIYPQHELGKQFWAKVYAKAQAMYGTTQIPVNTFNKVWIIPQKAGIYEHGQTAFIVSGHLKVMLEEDYLSLKKHNAINDSVIARSPQGDVAILNRTSNGTHSISSGIIRQIILPEIEKEVNEGKNFATLRQIFYAQVLAVWFKRNLKQALLNQVYANKGTVKGIDQNNAATNEVIFRQYLKAYKKGVFNYIQDDVNPLTQESMPRKYFSGGYGQVGNVEEDAAQLSDAAMGDVKKRDVDFEVLAARGEDALAVDKAMKGLFSVQGAKNLFKVAFPGRRNVADKKAVSANSSPNIFVNRKILTVFSKDGEGYIVEVKNDILSFILSTGSTSYTFNWNTNVIQEFIDKKMKQEIVNSGASRPEQQKWLDAMEWLKSTLRRAITRSKNLNDATWLMYYDNEISARLGAVYATLRNEDRLDRVAAAYATINNINDPNNFATVKAEMEQNAIYIPADSDQKGFRIYGLGQEGMIILTESLTADQPEPKEKEEKLFPTGTLSAHLVLWDSGYVSSYNESANTMEPPSDRGPVLQEVLTILNEAKERLSEEEQLKWQLKLLEEYITRISQMPDSAMATSSELSLLERGFIALLSSRGVKAILGGSNEEVVSSIEHTIKAVRTRGLIITQETPARAEKDRQAAKSAQYFLMYHQGPENSIEYKTLSFLSSLGFLKLVSANVKGNVQHGIVIESDDRAKIDELRNRYIEVLEILANAVKNSNTTESVVISNKRFNIRPAHFLWTALGVFIIGGLASWGISSKNRMDEETDAVSYDQEVQKDLTLGNVIPDSVNWVKSGDTSSIIVVFSESVGSVVIDLNANYLNGDKKPSYVEATREQVDKNGKSLLIEGVKTRVPLSTDGYYHLPSSLHMKNVNALKLVLPSGFNFNRFVGKEDMFSGDVYDSPFLVAHGDEPEGADKAMSPIGGIDLSQQDSALHVEKDANGGVKVNVDPSLIARIDREGMNEVIPVIINMRPADIKVLFGVSTV